MPARVIGVPSIRGDHHAVRREMVAPPVSTSQYSPPTQPNPSHSRRIASSRPAFTSAASDTASATACWVTRSSSARRRPVTTRIYTTANAAPSSCSSLTTDADTFTQMAGSSACTRRRSRLTIGWRARSRSRSCAAASEPEGAISCW